MDQILFNKICEELFSLNGHDTPTNEQLEKLYLLTDIMLDTSKVMNLTAIKEERSIILRHYVDSLLVSRYIPTGVTVLDVGCGAGFPTLPLAIFRPDLKITALDSTAKRIEYVRSTAMRLGCKNVTAVAARAEELGNDPKWRESFNVVTARAVASLPALTELCLPFTKLGGEFVPMKALKTDEEIEQAKNAIRICGGAIKEIHRIDLRDGTVSESRCIIQINKLSATPQNYPRHFSKISKKPL